MNRSMSIALSMLSVCALVSVNASSAWSAPKTAELSISTKAAELVFSKTKLTVKAGQTVRLTFTNGAAKDSGLQHNWVLVNPGTADAVGQESMGAGAEKGFLAESKDILAHSKLLNPGEKQTVEFTAPTKPGDYPYICTFPGHSMMMRGVLQVK